MSEKKVPVYPVADMSVSVQAEQGLVMLNLPYFTDFGTDQQQKNHDHAYAMLEEHALHLRDLLADALRRIEESRKN